MLVLDLDTRDCQTVLLGMNPAIENLFVDVAVGEIADGAVEINGVGLAQSCSCDSF